MPNSLLKANYIFLYDIFATEQKYPLHFYFTSQNFKIEQPLFPGLLGEAGDFSFQNSATKLENIINKYDHEIPLVLISYSISSLILNYVDLTKYKNIQSIYLLSPMLGLSKDWIKLNINYRFEEIGKSEQLKSELNELSDPIYGIKFVEKLNKLGIPVEIFYFKADEFLNSDNLKKLEEKISKARNIKFTPIDGGFHSIDSYLKKGVNTIQNIIENTNKNFLETQHKALDEAQLLLISDSDNEDAESFEDLFEERDIGEIENLIWDFYTKFKQNKISQECFSMVCDLIFAKDIVDLNLETRKILLLGSKLLNLKYENKIYDLDTYISILNFCEKLHLCNKQVNEIFISEHISDLLFNENFKEAEPLIKKYFEDFSNGLVSFEFICKFSSHPDMDKNYIRFKDNFSPNFVICLDKITDVLYFILDPEFGELKSDLQWNKNENEKLQEFLDKISAKLKQEIKSIL